MLTIVKKERIVFVLVLIVTMALLLVERLTSLEINNNVLLFFLVFTAIGNLALIISQYLFDALSVKYVTLLLLLLFLVSLGMAILTWSDSWKTQTLFYRNLSNPKLTIEYRMRNNKFRYGFEKQIVQRRKLLPYIDDIEIADTTAINKSEWIRVDEVINEMKFPGDYINLPD